MINYTQYTYMVANSSLVIANYTKVPRMCESWLSLGGNECSTLCLETVVEKAGVVSNGKSASKH